MIREADEKDCRAIADIYNHYIRNTVITFEETEIDNTEIRSRINKVNTSGLYWLVAEADRQISGYAYATQWRDRSAYRNSVEVTVYLDSDSIGRGYGTALYTRLLELLTRKGLRVAIGCIALPNEASVKLHEKLGFSKVGHLEEVGRKFGRWIDVGYWQVKLNA